MFVKYLACAGENQIWTNDCINKCGPQCNNFKGEKCDKNSEVWCDNENCICKPEYAFIEKGKCVPVSSSECGGLHKV